ncbi:MAG TPA: FdhF/YdeP family oxidoreductase [Trebonia sp.]|jgi:molybdopterin-dependent oxidoreductase alpha subunit|nr:FdhF/YdeP family oxidoreductase [Trebonia sp.]
MTEVEPVVDENVRVGEPEDSAVGIPGVAVSMRYALSEMGPGRSLRTLLAVNQADGFDCPSCAWADPAVRQRKHAEFCENGAKAVAWEATRKRVDAEFFARHPVAFLSTQTDHWLESNGRLTEPMYLAPGATHYAPIAWDDALRLVAGKLRGLDDPNRAVFYTSGRASNEAAFVYQLLARRLGTNNLPDCSNMCHESSGAALTETIGIGKGQVTIEDIADHADLIVIVGQNPGTNHPRMLTSLEEAKRRGAKIVAVNPLPEAGLIRFKNPQKIKGIVGSGTKLADRFLPVKVNGDLALFAGVNKVLAERDALDHSFIGTHTDGFDAALDYWKSLDWADVERLSGLTARQIEEFADDVVASKNVIVCWAMGLTQHKNAVATIREVMNFLLLRGNIGRPGAGPCPVRGHSNVQGDRTMGIFEKMPDSFLDAIRDEFGFEPPREHGWDTVASIRAMRDGKVDVFFALGGNFAAATPDTEVTAAALANCQLTVHVATKLNRSHLTTGREALILPCLGRTERDSHAAGDQFVTVEDSMSVVHASRGRLSPGSPGLRSEVAILTGLAHKLFGPDIDWRGMGEDYAVIRGHIANVIPGFADFEARVSEPGGFTLPRPPRDSLTFRTSNGKAHFTVNQVSAVSVPPGHLLLQTIRSHDQFNTTVYGLDDRYRGVHGGRRVVLVSSADLGELGFADGDIVDLVSVWSDGERRAPSFRVVAYSTPPGCAAAYFPETNVLVPLDSVADTSGTPTSKSVIIRLERR